MITQLSDMAMKSIGRILTIDDEEISRIKLAEIDIDALIYNIIEIL